MSVSDYLSDPGIDSALAQLDDERTLGLALLAFSRTMDRPENTDKIVGSHVGHVVLLQHACVSRELILWCSRMWDDGKRPTNGLPSVAKMLEEKASEIVEARNQAYPDEPEDILDTESVGDQILLFRDRIAEIKSGDLLKRLRVLRNEHLAHIIAGRSAF